MAYWAEVDENGIVLRVTVGSNDDSDEGYQWLIDNLGGTWIKTSYNSFGGKRLNPETREIIGENHFRYNFAGVGYEYNEEFDAFVPPKPEINEQTQFFLDRETFLWVKI